MINNQKKIHWVLWYETLGFMALVLLSWMNELMHLPHLLFRGGGDSSVHEAILETTIIVAVWFVVIILTRRLLKRLLYLEGFLRVCAWCRKVDLEKEWTSIEEYFARGFDIKTSHGMCPQCQQKWREDVRANSNWKGQHENIDCR